MSRFLRAVLPSYWFVSLMCLVAGLSRSYPFPPELLAVLPTISIIVSPLIVWLDIKQVSNPLDRAITAVVSPFFIAIMIYICFYAS